MESSHLVKFSTSGKFITKFNVLRCISLSETLFWTGARGQISITLNHNDKEATESHRAHTSWLCCQQLSMFYPFDSFCKASTTLIVEYLV